MTSAIVIGDGPAGLSAALFLAKNGVETTVFGQDNTAMHWAELHNYLGIPKIGGTEFQEVARGQVQAMGAALRADEVSSVEAVDGGFRVATAGGGQQDASFVVIAEGKSAKLAKAMGLAMNDDGVEVDREFRTAVDGLYVVGRATRVGRSQAIISAGQGATAAIDILSRLKGADFRDFDEPPKD